MVEKVQGISSLSPGQFLQGRTYRGLEIRLGEDAPGVLEQGRSGLARGYQDDHHEVEANPATYR